MRIIAGKFRGRRLKSPPGAQTRPTSDRLRETLFNILTPRIGGARFLDLCAGTGAVGIEALSRGAVHVVFVDQSRKMCALIEQNLEILSVEPADREVVIAGAAEFLRRQTKKGGADYDVIYFDPPYATDYDAALELIGEPALNLLRAGGVVIVEHHKKKSLADQIEALSRYRELKQGDSVLSFYHLT